MKLKKFWSVGGARAGGAPPKSATASRLCPVCIFVIQVIIFPDPVRYLCGYTLLYFFQLSN